jgi:HK97 family phage prohead protease
MTDAVRLNSVPRSLEKPMPMIRGLAAAQISSLADDEVLVILSTDRVGRDGHVLVPAGAQLDNYKRNPIWLFAHDTRQPVGRASDFRVEGGKIACRVTFAPLGISAEADKIRGLVKSGIISGVSVGFDPLEATPLDPSKPRAGQRVTSWELLECSFVSVPSDTGAIVTARAALERAGRVLSAENASKLQQAHDHSESCRALVADVLDTAAANDEGGDDSARAWRRGGHGPSRDRRRRDLDLLSLALEPESSDFTRRQRALAAIELGAVPLSDAEIAAQHRRRQAEARALAISK